MKKETNQMKVITKIKDLVIAAKNVLTGPVNWLLRKHKELTLKFIDFFEISTYTALMISFAKGLIIGGAIVKYLC
tara:strand:- start:641 stop:865 length:225 start_codon:yes stop_codon:yes gene_type:complete